MPAFGDAYSHPFDVQAGGFKDHVDQPNLEAARLRGKHQIPIFVGGEDGFDADRLMGCDGSLQPSVNAPHGFKIRLLQADRFNGLDSDGQEVRIYDPDRTIKILDGGARVDRTFPGPVRAGDDPKLRTIKLLDRHDRQDPTSSCVRAVPARRSSRISKSDRWQKSRCSHPR